MALPQMTRQLAYAAATDAANRRMRKAGRTKWTREDYNAAAREFHRLWPEARRQAAAWRRSHNPRTLTKTFSSLRYAKRFAGLMRLHGVPVTIEPVGRRFRATWVRGEAIPAAGADSLRRARREYFGSHGKNPSRRFPATPAGARRALAYANQMRRRGRPVSIWKT